jgi:hypothetical protein
MGSPVCPACSGKWAVISGGLCGVCRSLDRLAAYCRGPQFPAGAGDSLLTAVRTWIGFVQDLSETERGVVPCPRGTPLPGVAAADPGAGSSGTQPPAEPSVEGATAKAPGPPPPSVPKGEKQEDEEKPAIVASPKEPSSSHRSRRSPREERRSRTPKREKKKQSRKSRSRQRRRQRSQSRLASPVRPSGVKEEASPRSDSREALRRKKARPRSPSYSPPRPRSPVHSPPRAPLPRRVGPSARPEGSRWRGPIRAPRREPPPGQGKHFGKNKGLGKRKRNREFWRGAGRHRR